MRLEKPNLLGSEVGEDSCLGWGGWSLERKGSGGTVAAETDVKGVFLAGGEVDDVGCVDSGGWLVGLEYGRERTVNTYIPEYSPPGTPSTRGRIRAPVIYVWNPRPRSI